MQAADAAGNASQQAMTVTVTDADDGAAPVVPKLFEDYREAIEAIVKDIEFERLEAVIASHQARVRSARNRFIETRQFRQRCSDEYSGAQRGTLLNSSDVCSLIESRYHISSDMNGAAALGEKGLSATGTISRQFSGFNGKYRRIFEADFQLGGLGMNSKIFDGTGVMMWERFFSENTMLGISLGGTYSKSSVYL